MSTWPQLDREPVRLPAVAGSLVDIWRGLADLAVAAGDLPWTIVGGQMVLLHGLEHGRTPDRVTNDIDTAVDVRTDPQAVARLVAVLADLGYETAGTSPDGHAYRFKKRSPKRTTVVDFTVVNDDSHSADDPTTDLVVDVLVPEGLGPRTDITTIGRATAFPVSGVTQALRRSELVPVDVRGTAVWIPRPNLLGAIVAKATACSVDARDTGRHHTDLVFLCGLVDDPFELAGDVDSKDRRRLGRAARVLPPDHRAWRADPEALTALEILIAPPLSS